MFIRVSIFFENIKSKNQIQRIVKWIGHNIDFGDDTQLIVIVLQLVHKRQITL